jgi:hypothetical protein
MPTKYFLSGAGEISGSHGKRRVRVLESVIENIGANHLGGPMKEAPGHEITQLLKAWREGEAAALEKLVPLVYRELRRRLARSWLRRELRRESQSGA